MRPLPAHGECVLMTGQSRPKKRRRNYNPSRYSAPGNLSHHDKFHLVPFGEYFRRPILRLGMAEIAG
jgi:apolipoprotein N-acyltransferase